MNIKVYVGYDPRDHDAYRVCEYTLKLHASGPVEVIPLKDWELRASGHYWRSYRVDERGQMWDDRDNKPFSTQFSFTRFAVPLMEKNSQDWVIFCDADMMFRDDIYKVLDEVDTKALYCVQHQHQPTEKVKMDGVLQSKYSRKNWSSFMVMKPSRITNMTPFALNNWDGSSLHGLRWVDDGMIGALDKRWNMLVGYDEIDNPANVHFTLGTPDMSHYTPSQWDGEWWDNLDRLNKGIRDETPPSLRD